MKLNFVAAAFSDKDIEQATMPPKNMNNTFCPCV